MDGKSKQGSFNAKMGAEGILELLQELDLEKLEKELADEIDGMSSNQKRKKLVKRLKIVRSFLILEIDLNMDDINNFSSNSSRFKTISTIRWRKICNI